MDSLRDSLDRHARDVLPTTTKVYVALYLLISLAHWIVLPDTIRIPLLALSLLGLAAGMLAMWQVDSSFVQQRARHVVLALVVIAAINSAAHLYLSGEIKQTTNYIVLLLLVAYLLPGIVAFWGFVTVVLVSWVFISSSFVSDDFLHFAFALLLGVMSAGFMHGVRRSQLKQTVDLETSLAQIEVAGAALSQGQQLVQELLNKIPAGIHVRELNGDMIFVNEEAKKIAAQTRHESVAEYPASGSFEMYDTEMRPLKGDLVPLQRVQSGEEIRDEVVAVGGLGGEIFWGLLNMFRMNMESLGKEVIVTTFVNITDRRIAESQLREAETLAETILKSIADGVIAVNEHGKVTLFNESAARLTGVSEEFAVGHQIGEVFQFEENENESELGMNIRTGMLTSRSGSTTAIELVVSQMEGSRIKGANTGSQGANSGFVYTFKDISEQARLDQERATVDKMRSVGVLAGGIAHDFNNLLTSIYGNISLAEHHLHEPGRAAAFLKQSAGSIELATNLTSQLLTFARGSEPLREAVNLEKLVRESARLTLSGSGVAVTYSSTPSLALAFADAGQLQQAVSNIVLNAKQAMNDDGVLRITFRNGDELSSGDAERVEVVIEDQGPGIEPDLLGRIFEPYFTTKDTGSGLGLATAHSILLNHGGAISVKSSPGEGSRFVLSVPAAHPEDQPDTLVEPAQSPQADNLRILVMDDEEAVRLTMTQLLEHFGHEVVATQHGEDAIAQFKLARADARPFDVILMDLTIAGGMGGKEAAEQVLAIDPDARIIVASGYSAGAELANYEQFGFCARLEKPFRADALRSLISEVVSGR